MKMAGMVSQKGDNKIDAGKAPAAMSNEKLSCGMPTDTTPGKTGAAQSSGKTKHGRSMDKSENMKNMPKGAY